jgi:catechol 2,3-dioxygenase-like lactoylglutathione lyase family enzyme
MEIRFAVVSLWAEDVPAAAQFYQDVIGLPIVAHHAGNRPHFDLDGTYLTILHGRPALPGNPESRFPVVAFSVPDLDAAMKKLQSHEVNLPWVVETNAAERWVMVHDPAGNLIELMESLDQG